MNAPTTCEVCQQRIEECTCPEWAEWTQALEAGRAARYLDDVISIRIGGEEQLPQRKPLWLRLRQRWWTPVRMWFWRLRHPNAHEGD